MEFAKYETIRFERRDRVLTVIFNQPEKLNSFIERSHTELSTVFSDVAEDPESDIIVVTGSGRAFSAGGDILGMQRLRDTPVEFYKGIREAKKVVYSLLDCDKPVVAKVNGDAIGLGATVALFCDVVIATEEARLADPHNNVGLIAGDGGQIIWPQLIGYARAKHHLFTGEKINGKRAAEIGLIHAAVPAAELDAAVDAYVDRLSRLPAQSLRWTKATVNIPLKQLAHALMDVGMSYEGLASMTTADHGEAIKAFAEKRQPKFVGR
ncbi:enoyl-CoA hydratase (plasmid) [Azospirillum sp. B510]|uniref:enoyl-CoA hydratase/isomerase family protein n=1 Tax=Azospirillum sp. (strain B510) TaxID=137722 RepID=UPI0001C4CC16|nr:enoyl-CoA hydratase-related protein [Azospirillum sp. B510]BAI74876.1 enoyl-CoA hydratase [Azospirillum sp. B510]